MDNESPHVLAMKEIELNNIKAIFLSLNTTENLQPLDCCIIDNFKFKYRLNLLRDR